MDGIFVTKITLIGNFYNFQAANHSVPNAQRQLLLTSDRVSDQWFDVYKKIFAIQMISDSLFPRRNRDSKSRNSDSKSRNSDSKSQNSYSFGGEVRVDPVPKDQSAESLAEIASDFGGKEENISHFANFFFNFQNFLLVRRQ